jgi:hypothetical protein
MFKKLLFFTSLILINSNIFGQFSPNVSVSLSSLDCDTLSDLTINVSQDPNEIDMASATFSSNLGYFDFNQFSVGDTIGSAVMSSQGGLVSLNANLIIFSILNNQSLVQSFEINTSLLLGNFIMTNNIYGVTIVAASPSDGNSTTSGNSSSVTLNNIFHLPFTSNLIFNSSITSELGDIDNQNFTFSLTGACINCNVIADFGSDTINGCDSASVQISSPSVVGGSYEYITSDNQIYSGIWHDSIVLGHNVQDLLDVGINPLDIYNAGYSLSSIYGKYYEGGIIYYLNTNTGDGMVINDSDLAQVDWGCNNSLIGGTQTGLGTGQANTNLILSSCSQSGIAAQICDTLFLNGYDDWSLPSLGDLNSMFTNLQLNGYNNFDNYYYWSSSEWDNDEAYMFHFYLGYGAFADKSSAYNVRASRSFSYQPFNNLSSLNIISSGWNFVTVTDSVGCNAVDSVYVLLENSSFGLDIQTACDSFLWIDANTYFTSNNSATYTLVNSVGCDSVVSLDLTINYSSNSFEILTVCDQYLWNGLILTNSGLYDTILVNSEGCDSLTNLDLTVYYSNSGSLNITSCDSYLWQGVNYFTSGIYNNILTNIDGCDSVATLNLTINYSDTVPSGFNTFYICDGESVLVGNSSYTLPGTYFDTLADYNGCDSIVSTFVDVSYLSLSLASTPVTCADINDGSVNVFASNGMGIYGYLWSTSDTTSFIDNLLLGSYSVTVTDSLCSINGSVNIDLNIAPADSIHPEICYASVDFTGFNNVVLKPHANPLVSSFIILREYSAGLYAPLDTIPNNGTFSYRDSSSNPAVQAERYKVASIDVCGNVSDTSFYHKTVHLSMNTGINGEVNLAWNNYEGYQVSNYLIFRGDTSGTMTIIGSISGTNTSYSDINPPLGSLIYQVRALAQNCNTIQNYGTNSMGLFQFTQDTLESNIVDHDNLTLQVTTLSTNPSCDTCSDGSILANAVGGVSPYTYSWSNGVSGFFNGNLNIGTYIVYVFDDIGATTSDTVTLFVDVYGCMDSMAANYNSLANISDSSCIYCSDNGVSIDVTSCDSYLWMLTNTTFNSSGIYINILTDSLGCSTTDTLYLTINNSSAGSVDITVCDDFSWDGVVYDSTGSYTNTYFGANGCDSLMTLNLTINNSSAGSVDITACDDFTWDGVVYDATGSYTNTYTDVNGCDSLMTLNLTIVTGSTGSVDITACDDFSWDGVVYDSTGSYTNTYTDVNGCDSLMTLNLTINNSSAGSVDITACDDFTWDGIVYYSTGSYTNTYVGANGCDSLMTLNLTINNSSAVSVDITACDDFTWDGVVYDSTGFYTNTYTNVNGCDSLMTLNLTIVTGSTGSVDITACDDFTWDGVVYDSTGSYTNTYTDVNGCDSLMTLNLTINEGPVVEIIYNSFLGTLTANNIAGSTPPYSWLWNTGESTQSISADTSVLSYWCVVSDVNGCFSDTSSFSISLGVDEVSDSRLLIYPNPTKGILNIEFDNIDNKISSLSIVDILGDIIYNENIDNKTFKYSTKIDLLKYANGIYFVKLKIENKFVLRKIILQ